MKGSVQVRKRISVGCAILAAIAVAIASIPAKAIATPAFDIGVEVWTLFDSTRPYRNEAAEARSPARPIRVFLWYPAAPTDSPTRLTIGSYAEADWVSASDAVTGWAQPLAAKREFTTRLSEMTGRPKNHASIARAYRAATSARWLPRPAPGRFPLVLVSSGASARAYFHVWLAEYLARSGFVVAQVSTLGPSPGVSLAVDAQGLDIGLADTRHVLERLKADPRVAPGTLGLVGWSVGGVVQLRLLEHEPDVAAVVVSLDSGVGYDYAPRLLPLNRSTGWRSSRPYLHLSAGIKSTVREDRRLLSALGAIVEEVPGLRHADFTTVGLLADIANPLLESSPRANAHKALLERTLSFLTLHRSATQAYRAK